MYHEWYISQTSHLPIQLIVISIMSYHYVQMPPYSLLKNNSNKNFLRIIKLKLYMTRFLKIKKNLSISNIKSFSISVCKKASIKYH